MAEVLSGFLFLCSLIFLNKLVSMAHIERTEINSYLDREFLFVCVCVAICISVVLMPQYLGNLVLLIKFKLICSF